MEPIATGILQKMVEQGGAWLAVAFLIVVIVYLWRELKEERKETKEAQGKIVAILEAAVSGSSKVIAENTAAFHAGAASQAAATEATRQSTTAMAVLTETIKARSP